MIIGVLGGVVVGKVNVDVTETVPFSDIFCSIQEAVGKGPLWDKFNLHMADIQGRKVRPGARVIKPTDTPKSLDLPDTGALVVLRAKEPVASPGNAMNDVSEAATSARGSYRDRLIAIYQKYEPAKVGTVDATLKKFAGKEEAVISQLVKKYGPEPKRNDICAAPVSPSLETQEVKVESAPAQGFTAPATAGETNVGYRDRLIAIYQKYEPAKVGTVDATLKKFAGKEEAVISQLVKKYGPEPKRNDICAAPVSPSLDTQELKVDSAPAQGFTAPATAEETNVGYRDRLIAIYQKYEPAKVGTVDATLKKFAGKEEAVISQLVKKYGPEPKRNDICAAPVSPSLETQELKVDSAPAQGFTAPATAEETNVGYRDRLIAIYQKYEPAKVGTVDATLKKFAGKEEAVISQLVKKYGPEPKRNDICAAPVSPSLDTQELKVDSAPAQGFTAPATAEETNVGYRDRLIAIYQKYEPAKVGTVDATLKKFAGKEEAVISQLVKKYGPEPKGSDIKSTEPPPTSSSTPTLSLASDDNSSVTPTSTTLQVENVEEVVEKKKGDGKVKDDLNMVNTTISRKASTPIMQTDEPVAGGDVPASVIKSVDAVTPETGHPVAVSPVGKPLLEPYGFQKDFASPTSHELLDEPISETDANTDTDECAGTGPGEATAPKPSKDDAVRTAAVILNEDKFDTGKKLLRDLEQPLAKIRRDSSSSSGVVVAPTTSATTAERNLSERSRPTINHPRLSRIVHKAVASIGDAAGTTVRRAYWTKWLYRVAQRKANGLIANKVWARAGDGAQLVDGIPYAYIVEDLDIYIYERLAGTPRCSPVFSDTLQKALRGLLYAARECRKTFDEEELTSALSFADQELCPVGDTKAVAEALVEITGMIRELAECKAQLHTHKKRLARLGDEQDELRQELETAQSFVGRFASAQDELSKAKVRLEEAEEQSRRAQEEFTTMRYNMQNLQRELKKAHAVSPANMELALQQKDASLVEVQQELARTRTRLRREQAERENIAKQLEETKREASKVVQSLAETKTHSAFGETKSSAGMRTTRRVSGITEKTKFPRGFFSAQFRSGGIIDEDFQPSDAKELSNMTDVQLENENLRLESALRRSSQREELDFGFCPHCSKHLTVCAASRNGLPESKAAFCFSCRMSFTFKDLHDRDRLVELTERKGRGLSRRGPFVSQT